MTNRILLLSQNPENVLEIKKILARLGVGEVRQAFALAEVGDDEMENVEAAIIDVEVLNEMQLVLAGQVRLKKSQVPIVFVAQEIAVPVYQRVGIMRRIVTIQRPLNEMHFVDVLSDLLSGKSPVKNLPRFYTYQPIKVVSLNSGLLIQTRMTNYSAGGAFIEYKGIALKVGDELQLGFGTRVTNNTKKEFQLTAKVVWIKEGRGPNEHRGIGVKFVSFPAPEK